MNIRRILLLLLLPLLFSACTSYKKSLYLRDDEVLEMVPQKGMLYEYRIMRSCWPIWLTMTDILIFLY